MAQIIKPRIKVKVLRICNALIRLNKAAYDWEIRDYEEWERLVKIGESRPAIGSSLKYAKQIIETWQKIIHLANEMKKVIANVKITTDPRYFDVIRDTPDWLIKTAEVQIQRYSGRRVTGEERELNRHSSEMLYRGTEAHIRRMEDVANRFLS